MGDLSTTGVLSFGSRDTDESPTRQVADNGRSKTAAKVTRALRGAKLLELIASGTTIRDAAKHIGVSPKTAQALYQQELAGVMEANNDLRRDLIAQDLETLRLLVASHMPLALVGATDSAKVVLGCLDRRAKLLGLDAEIKVQVSNAKVDQVIAEIVGLLEIDNGTPMLDPAQGDE